MPRCRKLYGAQADVDSGAWATQPLSRVHRPLPSRRMDRFAGQIVSFAAAALREQRAAIEAGREGEDLDSVCADALAALRLRTLTVLQQHRSHVLSVEHTEEGVAAALESAERDQWDALQTQRDRIKQLEATAGQITALLKNDVGPEFGNLTTDDAADEQNRAFEALTASPPRAPREGAGGIADASGVPLRRV